MKMETKDVVKTTRQIPRTVRQSKSRKTIGDIYGKLKRGLDGMEYQNEARHG
jgi:hypothetical protein